MHKFRPQNLKFKHLIDDIATDLRSSWNFVRMEDIIKTCNPLVRFQNLHPIRR